MNVRRVLRSSFVVRAASVLAIAGQMAAFPAAASTADRCGRMIALAGRSCPRCHPASTTDTRPQWHAKPCCKQTLKDAVPGAASSPPKPASNPDPVNGASTAVDSRTAPNPHLAPLAGPADSRAGPGRGGAPTILRL